MTVSLQTNGSREPDATMGTQTSSVNAPICTADNAAASPAHTLYLTLNQGPAPHASLEIRPDGAVFVFGAGNANGVDTLSGLSYQLSS